MKKHTAISLIVLLVLFLLSPRGFFGDSKKSLALSSASNLSSFSFKIQVIKAPQAYTTSIAIQNQASFSEACTRETVSNNLLFMQGGILNLHQPAQCFSLTDSLPALAANPTLTVNKLHLEKIHVVVTSASLYAPTFKTAGPEAAAAAGILVVLFYLLGRPVLRRLALVVQKTQEPEAVMLRNVLSFEVLRC